MAAKTALGGARARVAWFAVLMVVSSPAALQGEAGARVRHGAMVDYSMVFPVDGPHYFRDTFGAPRSGGRSHEGQDIMAAKGTPVVAAAGGVVRYVNWTSRRHLNPERCCSVVLDHNDGWRTIYIHLNNDRPGTDDGKGWGIAEGIVPGARVQAGDLLGWVGDSGNAEETGSHLHLELVHPSGVHVNPFQALLLAGGNPPPDPIAADGLLDGADLLRAGDRGESVGRLQELLDDLGYDVGARDGIFGPRTAAAVRAFQADLGLAVDGVVGPQTIGGIAGSITTDAGVIGFGSRGDTVQEAQRLLASLGFDPGPSDGIFGPRTLDALLAFQRDERLWVDGLAGPQTLSRLGVR